MQCRKSTGWIQPHPGDRAVPEENPDNQIVHRVWQALQRIPDPEMPFISVVELGMIGGVTVEGDRVTIQLMPTFVACPGFDRIKSAIQSGVGATGFADVRIETVYDPPWNTDRITPEGRAKLKAFGLAPPSRIDARSIEQDDLAAVPCPFCDSTDTTLESPFGPTLCRSMHYCNSCRQSFQHFKPIT